MCMKLLSHNILVQGYKFLLFIVSEKGATLKFATDRRWRVSKLSRHIIFSVMFINHVIKQTKQIQLQVILILWHLILSNEVSFEHLLLLNLNSGSASGLPNQ